MSEMEKLYELNQLRADNFDAEICPEQKKYYLGLNEFYREHNCSGIKEATEIIRDTPYYDGAARAKLLDEINYREKAMREAGYDDVADMHIRRREKLLAQGLPYAYSQEWIDDYHETESATAAYTERKEIFGKIFTAYFNIFGNPQQEHRSAAVRDLQDGLDRLDSLGASFDELAQNRAFKNLTMLTDAGMERFIDYVRRFRETGEAKGAVDHDMEDEQKQAGRWISEHLQELVDVGKDEKWHRANCIAVPSDDPGGYDFISMKEVDD